MLFFLSKPRPSSAYQVDMLAKKTKGNYFFDSWVHLMIYQLNYSKMLRVAIIILVICMTFVC